MINRQSHKLGLTLSENLRAPFWLDPDNPHADFPDPGQALREPDGLLAVGGDLSPQRLLNAYKAGIFPWYSDGQPILWWSPDPRTILAPQDIKISRSLRKKILQGGFQITMDTAFPEVITQCSLPRDDESDTWITQDMQDAYIRLHEAGYAHSIEYWEGKQLLGGLYGVSIGKVYFGESMFTRKADASKIAFVYLCRQLQRWRFPVIDCQVHTDHLVSLGASSIPRKDFVALLEDHCTASSLPGAGKWHFDTDLLRELHGSI